MSPNAVMDIKVNLLKLLLCLYTKNVDFFVSIARKPKATVPSIYLVPIFLVANISFYNNNYCIHKFSINGLSSERSVKASTMKSS